MNPNNTSNQNSQPSLGTKIRGAAQAIHGMGENVRGTFLGGVDTVLHDDSTANDAVAAHGREKGRVGAERAFGVAGDPAEPLSAQPGYVEQRSGAAMKGPGNTDLYDPRHDQAATAQRIPSYSGPGNLAQDFSARRVDRPAGEPSHHRDNAQDLDRAPPPYGAGPPRVPRKAVLRGQRLFPSATMGLVDRLLADAVRWLVFTSLRFVIGMPFFSVLVRYRANYTPLRLQLPEDDMTPPADDVVRSYFGIFRRVYRIEGWAGLYKGLAPAFLTSLLVPLVQMPVSLVAALLDPSAGDPEAISPVVVLYALLFFFILPLSSALLLIPMQILTCRAITTQHHLPFFAPKTALTALLSPAERQRPYLLYATPGLAAANTLLAFCGAIAGLPVPILAIALSDRRDRFPEVTPKLVIPLVLGGLLVIVGLAFVVTPLALASVRLALQRRESSPVDALPEESSTSASTSTPTLEADAPLILSEPVIALRTEPEHGDQHVPYPSLHACLRTVSAEEGRKTLFRGWWIVLLQLVVVPTMFVGSPGRGIDFVVS
uniref:Mitochondrial carrier n=1 Tax=Mycena chlorophos TaxID=658473 RepID=A0ABQ0LES1_MYCCL|nr:predicted protein [Mycena chlorophos]